MQLKNKTSMKSNNSTKGTMFSHSRSVRVFMLALVSIMTGAVILKALSFTPLSAGAFSLSKYYGLEPVETVIAYNEIKSEINWNRIEITYNTTATRHTDIEKSPNSFVYYDDTKYHFIICNGFVGEDGQIIITDKWKNQRSITNTQNAHLKGLLIRIYVIPDGKTSRHTQLQVTRTNKLIETLSRKFHIRTESISQIGN